MKKLFGIIAALFVTASAFAGGYKGDFQLNFGAGFDSLKLESKDFIYPAIHEKRIMETGFFEINLETWHVFGSGDVFNFGFMVAFEEGLGGTTKYESDNNSTKTVAEPDERALAYKSALFIAPAFTFTLGDVVRFNVAPGLSILFAEAGSILIDDLIFSGTTAIGPGIEVQAKFCPNAHVSPVIGYRFTANFSNKFEMTNLDLNESVTLDADSIVTLTNSFTVGISWNW